MKKPTLNCVALFPIFYAPLTVQKGKDQQLLTDLKYSIVNGVNEKNQQMMLDTTTRPSGLTYSTFQGVSSSKFEVKLYSTQGLSGLIDVLNKT